MARRSSRRAQDLASRYRGTIAELDAAGLRALLDEADELEQELSRLHVYSYLRLSMAATDVEANDLATFSRDRVAEIENTLVFLGLEWIALDDDRAEQLLAADELAPYAHKLRVERQGEAVRPERAGGAGAERAPPDGPPPGRRCTTGMSRRSRCRSTRARARRRTRSASCSRTSTGPTATSACARSTALFEGLAPRADVLAACYDALVGDRLSIDRLRGYANPMQPTNLGNELDDEIVEAMMTATEEAYPIARKWFETKARLLGLDKLELADQYAPIGEARRSPGRRRSTSSTRRSTASRRGSRRSSARASRPATSTCCRGTARPAAPTARPSRSRSCRTSS